MWKTTHLGKSSKYAVQISYKVSYNKSRTKPNCNSRNEERFEIEKKDAKTMKRKK
jgi:hypothetical protein